MAEVIVVGGGLIGVSAAYRLAQDGARVTLLEARQLAGGTSSTSFAWINANNKPPLAYHRLNAGGMSEHVRLRQEFGGAPWLHLDGNVMWESPTSGEAGREAHLPVQAQDLAAKVERLRAWNYPVEILSRDDLARSHPDLAPPEDIDWAAFFPTEGYIDVPLLVAHLARAARDRGAQIMTGQRVVAVVRERDRVTGVRTAAGETFHADVVVSCVGRWTDELTALAGVTIPMAPTRGLLAITRPAAVTLRSLVHTPRVNLRPDGGSRLMLASFELDAALTPEQTEKDVRGLADELVRRATAIVPALGGSTIEAVRIGVRSIPRDRFPVVGPVPGVHGLYVVATHSGVTMGPLLGRIAAREILRGHVDDRILTYRPKRFVGAATDVTG